MHHLPFYIKSIFIDFGIEFLININLITIQIVIISHRFDIIIFSAIVQSNDPQTISYEIQRIINSLVHY